MNWSDIIFKKFMYLWALSTKGLEAGAAPQMSRLGANIPLLRSQDSLEKQLVLGPGPEVPKVRLGPLVSKEQGSTQRLMGMC